MTNSINDLIINIKVELQKNKNHKDSLINEAFLLWSVRCVDLAGQ